MTHRLYKTDDPTEDANRTLANRGVEDRQAFAQPVLQNKSRKLLFRILPVFLTLTAFHEAVRRSTKEFTAAVNSQYLLRF